MYTMDSMANRCNVPGCTSPRHGGGYCSPHYKRWKRHGDPLVTTRLKYGLDFWEYVDMTGDCWVWTGGRTKFGYGQARGIRFGMRTNLAHRIAWAITNGPLAATECVLHRCDNPPCVRPDHLFIGTKADNSADMVAKGRGRAGAQPWEFRTHGTRNARAKLTEAQVVEMRRRHSLGEKARTVGPEFGISVSAAFGILAGRSWRHVKKKAAH